MSKSKSENKATKTTTPRPKPIKLSHIKAESKKINKMESYTLDEEKGLVIKYYLTFPENKIQELLTELHETMVYVNDKKIDYFENEIQFMQYLHMLILKHFTSLESEIPKDFETVINIMDQIVDIGLFKTIFDFILDGNEVLKVIDRVEEMSGNVAKLNDAIAKEMAKLDKLENKDILSKPFNVMNDPSGLIQ